MKATGIVRRIDDLGRVVIPKEIRRVLRIREGDPLEIYTSSSGEVILKKYSPINELGQFAGEYAETASSILGSTVIVSDTDQIVAASGAGKSDYMDKKVDYELSLIHILNEADCTIEKTAYYIQAEDLSNASGELASLKDQLLFLHYNETLSAGNIL